MRPSALMLGLVAGLAAATARGAGFDKVVPWSGQYGGLANAGTSVVEGAQSLYFNPAGLATPNGAFLGLNADRRFELSLSFSPTLIRLSGPTTSPATVNGEVGFTPPFAGLVSWRPIDRLGIGAGVYASAGIKALFKNVDFSHVNPNFDTLKPDLESKLDIIEASLGAAYELLDGLRVGASWRASLVNAGLSSALPIPAPAGSPPGTPPVALVAVTLDSLRATDFSGFRVGLQYAPPKGWGGLGLMWRSPLNFTAEGDVKAQLESGVPPNGPAVPLPATKGKVTSQLPSQIALGGWLSLFDRNVRLVAEYTFTHYRVDRVLGIDATLTTPSGPVPVPDIVLDWDNLHIGRVGVELLAYAHQAIRLGYAIVSQVTPAEHARATLIPPGFGHSLVLGWGYWRDDGLRVDAALEYTFASGNGTNEFGIAGAFRAFAIGAHLGGAWTF